MDLGRFLDVAWRRRRLMALGLVAASAVALLSFIKIGFDEGRPSVSYRQDETWLTTSTLLLTQDGFPWGRATLTDELIPAGGGSDASDPTLVPRYANPARYSGLSAIYAELAKGDAVRARAMTGAERGQRYDADVAVLEGLGTPLPLVHILGYGPSKESATAIAERASNTFIAYLESQQASSDIPFDKRVDVVITQKASPPELFEKRPLMRTLMLFALILAGFVATAFGLENLRARADSMPPPSDDERPMPNTEELWPPNRESLPVRKSA